MNFIPILITGPPNRGGQATRSGQPGRVAATGVPAGAAAVPSKAANMAAGAVGEGAIPNGVFFTLCKTYGEVVEYF
jgi:hypothetical protein